MSKNPVLLVSETLAKSQIAAFTRKDGTYVQAHDDKRVAASKSPPLATHAKALRESSKPGDMDHWHNQVAADQMAAGDHKALSGTLKGMDTAARDHVLEHVHPDHHAGLGFETINHARSVAGYDKKFPAAKPKAAKPAKAKEAGAAPSPSVSAKKFQVRDNAGNVHKVFHGDNAEHEAGQHMRALNQKGGRYSTRDVTPKPEDKPAAAGGYVAPGDGDVGSEEHKQYGAYFRRGDKVKDSSGGSHEVLSHTGPQVTTTTGEKFHPTKLKFSAGRQLEKSMLVVRADLLK